MEHLRYIREKEVHVQGRLIYLLFIQFKSKYKPGDVAFKVKRKLHMFDIDSVTVR